MGSCLVEVGDIAIEHALELLLMEDQQVVEAFLPYTSQEALADRIGSGCMIRCFENLDVTCPRHSCKARPEFAIVITDQIFRHLPIGSRFPELLGYPGIGRRARDAHVDHLPRLEFDEEEGKERSKEQIGDLEEVAGPDLCGVIAQKGRPLLALWLVGANRPHVLLDSALAQTNAQFQEFTPDPFSPPESILFRHLSDQGDGLSGDLWLMSKESSGNNHCKMEEDMIDCEACHMKKKSSSATSG
jgi:hypothetical protein